MHSPAQKLLIAAFTLALVGAVPAALAQRDSGPRTGPAAAGGAIPALTSDELNLFTQAMQEFMEVDSVSGTISGEPGRGLGPAFNGNSCAQCHAQPAAGGSSPGLSSPQVPTPNPQVALATLDGATNAVPSFIREDGPVREARFIRVSNQKWSALDGGVHALYSIKGRSDAPGCNLAQPNFAAQLANRNVVFRIPTPTFGLGLVEATPDATLRANLAANQVAKSRLGIAGTFNRSGNDGTIARFGWKAQNKSLLMFSGEAYAVEQGVSNELFVNERSEAPGCAFNHSPEDATRILSEAGNSIGSATEMASDTVSFANFMRLLAPPTPAKLSPSAQNGQIVFSSVGCALCHTATLTTGPSRYSGMSNVTYHPYSDFALHHMGSGLADGIYQGNAGPDQFRTAPLWGVGQRLYFLHDGRTSDLMSAIRAHSSTGSEANVVISRFNALTPSQMQDLLNFLRSL